MNPSSKISQEQGGGNSNNPWVDRIYLVDDHPFFAAALASLINTEADMAVCGHSADFANIIADVARFGPDILVMDVNLSSRNNWSLAIELRKLSKSVPLLFVSSLQNPQVEMGLKWLEPCGFVEKTKDPADIIKAIRQTLAKLRLFQSLHPAGQLSHKRETQRE
ncbi:MAG: response regulator transcription factor [Nibricoccus sp.]